MSLVVPMLRLLLCLVLVLNGAGTAAASVRMSGPAQAPAAASHVDNDAHAIDCASHPVEHGGRAGTGSHPDPDCCKSASCTCACVHGCATMLPMPASAPVVIAHAGISVRLPTGHPAPALPHLIRPPIR